MVADSDADDLHVDVATTKKVAIAMLIVLPPIQHAALQRRLNTPDCIGLVDERASGNKRLARRQVTFRSRVESNCDRR